MGGGLGFEFLGVSGVGYKETGDAGVGRQTDGDPREFSDTARRLPAGKGSQYDRESTENTRTVVFNKSSTS